MTPGPSGTTASTQTGPDAQVGTRHGGRPRRHLLRRWAGLASATLVLVIGTVVGGIVIAQPAAAASVLNFCDADQTFAKPVLPTDTATASSTNQVTEKYEATKYVVIDGGQLSPADAYAGAGISGWSTFGMTCTAVDSKVSTLVAGIIYNAFVTVPLHILAILLKLGMSPAIGNWITDNLSAPMNSLYQDLFLTWGGPLIALGLVGGMFALVRRRGGALRAVTWPVVVVAGVALLVSPAGINVIKGLNTVTSTVETCAAFAFTGGCSAGGDPTQTGVFEALGYPTWAGGALGAQAGEAIPDTLTFSARNQVPVTKQKGSIAVPLNVIPAVTPGKPTWGEVWRWTGTYTAAEKSAMDADASLRCSAPASSPPTEALTDPGTHSFTDYGGDGTELCSYKWIVRAAMLANLADNQPDVYGVARGDDGWARLGAAFAGAGVGILVLGIGAVGAVNLVLTIELLLVIAVAPIVAMAGLRDATTIRRWANRVAGTIIRRVAVGIVLGAILWVVQGALSLGSTLGLPGPWTTLGVAIVAIAAMAAGIKLFSALTAILDQGVGVDGTEVAGPGKAAAAGKAALSLAVGAAGGALGAGTGMRLAGAAKGLARTATSTRGGSSSPIRAALAAHRAGASAAARIAAEDAGPGTGAAPTPTPRPTPTPPVGPRPGEAPAAGAAWADLESAPEVQAAQQVAVEAAARRWRAAGEAHAIAEQHLAQHRAGAEATIGARRDALVVTGVDAPAAERQARAEHAAQDERLATSVVRRSRDLDAAETDHRAAQTGPSELERALDAAIRAGQDTATAARTHGLTPATEDALRRYAAALRQQTPQPTEPWA